MVKKLGVPILLACLPACLLADFSYDESTKITGGMMAGVMKFAGAFSKQAREPIQSTVAVKGNRMLHGNKDRASVIDLDNETITEINYQKKTYSVMTFAEMKQAMEQAMQRMKDAPKQPPQQASQEQKPDVKTDFKLDIKNTGESREIAGLQAKETILTMSVEGTDQQSGNKGAMVIVSDMWLAPKIPGYDEITRFHRRMAEKMAVWTPDSAMNPMMGRPDMARAMENMRKEGAKMEGIPVLTVMKMTGSAEGQPSSGTSDTQTSSQQSKPQPKPDLGSVLGGKLGGFGGFGRKKKQDDSQASSTPPPSDNASASGSLMETTTEMSSFSSAAIDPSRFSPPAGFKKVESEMMKRQRQ
jgi:hypothetical protein